MLATAAGFSWSGLLTAIGDYGLRVVAVLFALALAWLVAGWARRSVRRRVTASGKIDHTLGKFVGNAVRWIILLAVILGCLELFGIHATSFAAVLGAAGLAIGFALQGTLANFASGVMLLVFRPFKVGDLISVSGSLGIVNEIDLFITEIDTPDGRRLLIPNGQIFGSTIENISHHPRRRAEVEVGTAYGADIDQARRVLTEAAQRTPGALTDPAPDVVLRALGESSIDWTVRAWARREEFLTVRQALLREVKLALDAAEIEIPFPQRTMWHRHEPAADGTAPPSRTQGTAPTEDTDD